MNKKILSLFLCVAMILLAGVISVSASDASEGLSFSPSGNGTCSVVGIGTCTDTEIIIPRYSPDGNLVTSIGYMAFSGCSSLTSIEIPKGVTSIGNYAFYYCSSLTSIIIPDSVTRIGDYAFEGCSSLQYNEYNNGLYLENETNPYFVLMDVKDTLVTSFEFNENTNMIGSSALERCSNLTSIEIPEGVTSIGYMAFSGCRNLTSIEIPEGVTNIGNYVFQGCGNLQSIVVSDGNPVYHSAGNCLIETASKTLIAGCQTSIIPTDGSVTSIGEGAFHGCSGLASIEIPGSVKSIGSYVFAGCSGLTSIALPESVTNIGEGLFYGCSSLEKIVIKSKTVTIGNGSIPSSVTIYGYADSTAQEYATANGNPFVILDDAQHEHTWDNGKVTKEPTCKDTGVKTYTCTECGGIKTAVIPVTKTHTWDEWQKDTAESHKHTCTVCGKTESEAHTWDEGKITTPASHVKEGVKTYTCTVCNETKTETVPKTSEHSYGSWEKHNETQHKHSCACGDVKYENHTWDNGKMTKEPTCKDTGVKTYTCAVCGETKTEIIPITGNHTWDEGKVTKEPTCKDTGVKTYTCTECGGIKTAVIPVTKTHTWGEWQKDTAESHKHTCTVCGNTESEAHTWDEGKITTPASHVKEGVKTYTCTACSETKTETVPKTAEHSYGSWEKYNETQHVHKCICGEAEYENHSFGEWNIIKEATENEYGVKRRTCTKCEAFEEESISPIPTKTSQEEQSTASPATTEQTDPGDSQIKTLTILLISLSIIIIILIIIVIYIISRKKKQTKQ